jgi:hypothetical protein
MFEDSDITPCSPVNIKPASRRNTSPPSSRSIKYANQLEEGSSKKGEKKFPFVIVWTPPEDGNKYVIIY